MLIRGLGPLNHAWRFRKLGALPDAPCFCFADAVWWLRKTGNVGARPSQTARVRQRKEKGWNIRAGPAARPSQTARVRQRKEKGGASGRDPDYRFGQEKVQEAKLPTTAGPKPP